MANKILDIYSDYLICQNKYATATGLSDCDAEHGVEVGGGSPL